MSNNLAYLELRMSGGGSNSDPAASLGGVKSSTRIKSKTASGISNITGVVVDDAPGSANGAGTLAFTASGQTLTWTPNGGTAGDPVAVGTDGRYAIPGSTGYLFVTVTASSLPGTDQNDTITVAQKTNELFDDISKPESFNGDVEYRCFYLHNAHPTDPFVGVLVWIGTQTNGADEIKIGLDLAGVGNGSSTGVADTVATESDAPSPTVTFSLAASEGACLTVGQLNASESCAVWMERTVPAATLTSTASDFSALTIKAGY